eukprot:616379-Rhodomonas_salina.2
MSSTMLLPGARRASVSNTRWLSTARLWCSGVADGVSTAMLLPGTSMRTASETRGSSLARCHY